MKKACFGKALAPAVIVLVAALSVSAQGLRPMTVVDLINVPSVRDPQLSPDGSQLLYVRSDADWKANKRISHIWRVNADGTGSIQLTSHIEGESSPRWSPDGRTIAFLAKRGEEEHEQIYLIPNIGGEARPLTSHASAGSNISWSPDGESIYFLAADPKTPEEKAREEAQDDVIAFDEDYKQRHLWKVSLDDGPEERITEGDFSIRGYRLSRDGSKISFHRAPTPLFDDSDEGEVWVMDSDGGNAEQLTRNTVSERGATLSPDNTQVLFTTDSNERFETYYNDNIFIVPAGGGRHRMLLRDMPHEVQSASWSADGRSVFFTANTGVRSELFLVDVENERLEQVTTGDQSIGGWSYVPSAEKHVFSINTATNAGDVWSLAVGSTSPVRITRVYDYLSDEFRLPRQEAIEWEGEDGVRVGGLVYYPLDYQSGTRYPLIVQTHGGPAASDKFGFGRWSNYTQVLTAMGYMVLKPNYRGSTGYGDDYLRDMVGHYYRQAHLDVMTGVDHLIEQGLVDGDRMGKMGWSGGGHMTNKIITHTDRFKAASSGAGAVNWISMYAQSDVRIYRTPWFGGTPWQENAPIDVYWDNSPLKDIHRVTTPTIVLVGEKDVRVPSPQSVELYRALKSNGVDTHLYIAPREPHGWQELRHELFKVNVELDWFEKHVMGKAYSWEEAPSAPEEEASATSSRQN